LHESSNSLFQTLGDKGERAATVNFVQGELRLLWRSWWWFWLGFKRIWMLEMNNGDECMHASLFGFFGVRNTSSSEMHAWMDQRRWGESWVGV
jgi:hypothetical protein